MKIHLATTFIVWPLVTGGTGGLAAAPPVEQLKLAKLLENPVANLISVPIQNNWDYSFGSRDGSRYTLNVQPVIPFTLNENWNLITRTIVPYISQENVVPEVPGQPYDEHQDGLGDITQSFFFSPSRPVRGLILGGGPVFRYPTATDEYLGGEQWGAGPTLLAIRQDQNWTYGGLVNHLWSFAGSDDRRSLNATFLQPVVAYNFKTATTVSLASESLYDWKSSQWTVPVQLSLAQMIQIGDQPVRLAIAARSYLAHSDSGPDWGLRFQITLPFPK